MRASRSATAWVRTLSPQDGDSQVGLASARSVCQDQVAVRDHGLAGAAGAQRGHWARRRLARVSGDVSPGAYLNARHGVGVRGPGWRLIVPALGAGTVVRFEVFGRSRWWHGAPSSWAAVAGAGASGVVTQVRSRGSAQRRAASAMRAR